MAVDFHFHTMHSPDASGHPAAAVIRAVEIGLAAVAVTDHNTVSGVEEAREAAQERNLRFLPAVEVDARDDSPQGTGYHYLLFWPDLEDPVLNDLLKRNYLMYEQHVRRDIAGLADRGMEINIAELEEFCRSLAPGNPLPSMWKLRNFLVFAGFCENTDSAAEVIRQVRREHSAEYLRPVSFSELLHAARGARALILQAHPGMVSSMECPLARRLEEMIRNRQLDGFEVFHPEHYDTARHIELAKLLNCAISGGSDAHNPASGDGPLGSEDVPEYVLFTMESMYYRRYGCPPPILE